MNNIKVGIVTFHNAHNYGAVLQAYGLHRKLELLGIKSEFIQDKNDLVGKKYQLFPDFKKCSFLGFVKSWLLLLLDYKRKSKRFSGFNDFITNYLPTYDLNKGVVSYSHVALGSDQIWNFNITKGLQEIYFGEDDNINSNYIFSYAASMGNGMVKPNFTEQYKNKLSHLNNFGVREKSCAGEIKSKFGLDSTINVDPTLLLEKEEWDKLVPLDNKSEEPYLLVYEVEKNPNTSQVVEDIKNKMGLKVKVILAKIKRGEDKGNITTASPQDFLRLFKNASFVVTTSFHGTVFSIINEIPFYTVKFNNKIDLRAAGLLESLDLEERHINNVNDITNVDLDFHEPNNKLIELRAKSTNYLKKALFNN